MPDGEPFTPRRPKMIWKGFTSIGSGEAPTTQRAVNAEPVNEGCHGLGTCHRRQDHLGAAERGKVLRSIRVSLSISSDTQAFKRAIDMTDDELAAIAGRAELTIVNQILSPLSQKLRHAFARLTSMSPNGILRMSKTRFICARKSWHVDHRGEIRQRSAAVTFAIKTAQRRSHICN